MTLREVVVVGASAAGMTAATTLRREGFDGRLTIVGNEDHPPYDRPPLSKQVLSGQWTRERITLPVPDGVTWRLGTAATALDLPGRRIALADRSMLGFDGLVIATGVSPKRLPFGDGLDGVHLLRTLDDAEALRKDLLGAESAVVVGAGFLGAEVSAVARTLGAAVTLVDPLPAPLVRQVGVPVAGRIARLLVQHGAELKMSTGVRAFHGAGRVSAVELTDGAVIAADVVVVAVGSTPATGWLRGSGVALGDGVECDELCRAAPGIVAAGDVAAWHHRGLRRRVRLEHRMNATEQGMAAARTLLAIGSPFAPVPYFWTDLYDVKIQAYGLWGADAAPEVVHGAFDEDRFAVVYREDGRITGALGWNAPRETRALRAAIGTTG